MATLFDVKQKALRRLGVLSTGQTMTGETEEQVTTAYNALYGELQVKNLIVWPKNGDVPDPFVEHVIDMLAFNLANEFGVSDARWQRLSLSYERAQRKLAELIYPPYVSTSEPVDF